MTAQILAAVIFVGMFALIIMDKFERQYVTLGSAALVLVVVFGICMHSWDAIKNALNLGAIFRADFWYGASESASSGVNWSTIFFITGMMIMVEGLGKSGFFRWLFLATVTLELAQILRFDPVPMILSEVFCANLGGAATMCGDPPNIIIGTALGYTFTDFIENTGIIIGICFVFVLIFFWLCFRKPLKASEAARPADAVCPAPATAIANRKAFVADVIVFLIAVALLVTHAQTGLTVSCIGVIVACLTLLVTVFTNGGAAVKEVIRGVDYKTLLFFIGLFISVAGLEQTGVLKLIAQFISTISGGSIKVVILIILLLSAVCSALIDNIPFAATMVPVVQSIAATQGMDLSVLAWALSLGTDLGGNATPIGASANVVATSVSAKSGHPISWGKYCKYCVPATVLVIAVSLGCLFLRYL